MPLRIPPAPAPIIREKYLEIPSQRFYALSLALVFQAIKFADFFTHFFSVEDNFKKCGKWMVLDFIYCTGLAQLRIPRLYFGKTVIVLQIFILWIMDSVMFGNIRLNFATISYPQVLSTSAAFDGQNIPSTTEAFSFLDHFSSFAWTILSSRPSNEGHLVGQLTVRLSPVGTALLNPHGTSHCISGTKDPIWFPVLLNNTEISELEWSHTPFLNDPSQKKETFNLKAKDFKLFEKLRLEQLQAQKSVHDDDYDEYDDEDDIEKRDFYPFLRSSESIVHIKVSRPGILRLESAYDSSKTEIQVSLPDLLAVAPCPYAEFIDDPNKYHTLCAGEDTDLQLMIRVRGVPPLSLRWLQTVNGITNHLLLEGIENGSNATYGDSNDSINAAVRTSPLDLKVPLSVSLNEPGSYTFELIEIVDGMGNAARLDFESSASDKGFRSRTNTRRSVTVLRRAGFSFAGCRLGSPISLLIGSEAQLAISADESDDLDSPWEINLSYQPSVMSDYSVGDKRHKPYTKILNTQGSRAQLAVGVGAPGTYTILGVRGKWCLGDVLAPESCIVVEKRLPTAEIEWKQIHECSGDTGVSASLILHGTPPFQVYYSVQRDKEPPRELSRTIVSSRGELTIQPERSGHYTFTIVRISDSYYKQVELNGPTIDQIIHPPASADFETAIDAQFGNRRSISSCEGDTVSTDVKLKGTGPWSLEIQIISPHSSNIIEFQGIETPKKSIQVPIPNDLENDGGIFDINIVSVEDAYKCKRLVKVPGISVNVRGIKPTAKFYGTRNKRRASVLENDTVRLPLRLTGDAPWQITYRRRGYAEMLTRTFHNQNDQLVVKEDGIYELINVTDFYCRGSIVADASTYEVYWTPRPSARLSLSTRAIHDPYNGSHILPTVCDGMIDYVELEFQGHPPFQILYNVARGVESGGTELIDQPTLNSIQKLARFQLHTSQLGRIYYEVKQIGDSNYPLMKYKNSLIPPSKRLLFEQQVFPRPSARFKDRKRMTYCLNDAFTPLDPSSADGAVLIDGSPPYVLEFSIKSISTKQIDWRTVDVVDHVWKIDISTYIFKSVGPHLVTIESVQDLSGCSQATLDPLSSSIWVDVAETAAIVPFERETEYCVGDIIQFQLEGIPPWNIGYGINGKLHTHETSTSPFSIQQQLQGEFVITSIAHREKLCKAAIADLHFNVHPLPSAKVGHGKRVVQNIHEGEQAEIIFTLNGEPPFSFTYQRSEAISQMGKPIKVLETHTVSGVNRLEYSIFSALEGTWTVTSISDRYCRYPAVQSDF